MTMRAASYFPAIARPGRMLAAIADGATEAMMMASHSGALALGRVREARDVVRAAAA